MSRVPRSGEAETGAVPSAAHRWLGDTPSRSYAAKLERFERFAAPELRRIFADLAVDECGPVLDVGCGTGYATSLLAQAVGFRAPVIGVDLSLPHLQAAGRRPGSAFVQSDAWSMGVRDACFDLIWACNTLNHLADPVAALRRLVRHLRSDGRIVVAQSGFLPEMFFAWDAPLDEAVRAACHRYYRERYGLTTDDTARLRAVVGLLREAGAGETTARTYVIERVQPLSDADREYFRHVVFEGTWNERIEPYLSHADREKLRRNCDPNSPEYCLDRPDFHHVQTLTVCEGRAWRRAADDV